MVESENNDVFAAMEDPGAGVKTPERESSGEDGVEFADTEIGQQVVEALKTVYDPEIPVNIYDLGLIYGIKFDAGTVHVDMTLTAPGCPVSEYFPTWVSDAVKTVEGIDDATVEIVWDPPWTPDQMSEEAKLELGFM